MKREERPPPRRAFNHSSQKAGAKLLQFFELSKYFCIFFTLLCVFVSKTPNILALTAPEWGLIPLF